MSGTDALTVNKENEPVNSNDTTASEHVNKHTDIKSDSEKNQEEPP